MHKMICLPGNRGEGGRQRVIYPVSSGRNERNGSIKFLIRLAMETWHFFFLLAYCLTGDRMTALACVSRERQVEWMSACVQGSRI